MRGSDNKLTKHHIIPTSKGGENKDNIAMVKQGLHRKYHDLFSNRTPTEILEFLENYFWGGNESFIDEYRLEEDISKHIRKFEKTFGVKEDGN
jgi:hypothetical protein